MPAVSQVRWDPTGLNAAVLRGFVASVKIAGADAKATAPNSKSGVRTRVAGEVGYLIPTGLGAIFEEGRHFSGIIYPGGVKTFRRSYSRKKGATYRDRSLRGSSSTALNTPWGPRAWVKGSDMAAEPYLKPAAARWAAGGCQATMRGSLLLGGFR